MTVMMKGLRCFYKNEFLMSDFLVGLCGDAILLSSVYSKMRPELGKLYIGIPNKNDTTC